MCRSFQGGRGPNAGPKLRHYAHGGPSDNVDQSLRHVAEEPLLSLTVQVWTHEHGLEVRVFSMAVRTLLLAVEMVLDHATCLKLLGFDLSFEADIHAELSVGQLGRAALDVNG